jgi:hypothetical protein
VINICTMVLNRYDMLRALLLSLQHSTVVPDAVYVINNGLDKDKIADAIADTVKGVVVLNPNRPLGVAESWNWFINNVGEDRIITNDDIEFAPESIAVMLADPADFVSCTYGFSCFLLRASCIQKVGLFDEAISPGYGYFEDMDYLHRMRLADVADSVVKCGTVHHQSRTPAAYTQEEWLAHHRRFALAHGNYVSKWSQLPRDEWEHVR